MGFQILASDKVVKLNDYPLLGQVQSVDWNSSLNSQEIFEIGRDTRIAVAQELETNGSFEILSIGGTAGVLARMIPLRDGAGAFTGYLYNQGGGSGKNAYTITQSDIKEAQFDIVMDERSDQTSFDRSTTLPRCFLQSITGRADANGTANETINFLADFVVVSPSPYHDVRAIPATRTTGSTCTLKDIAVTNSTHALMYLYIDERRLRTTITDAAYATLGAAGIVTITGLTIGTRAIMRAIVWDNTSPTTTFPVLSGSDRTTTAFFVRGHNADVFIAPAAPGAPVESEKWLRVQSIDWTIDMRPETLRQVAKNLAGTSIYCRVPTYPLSITANVTTYESDWAEWKAMFNPTNKPFGGTGTNAYLETFDFSPDSFKDSFSIVVRYYTKSGTLLQYWNFSDMSPDTLGDRITVGGRAEVQWSFKGTAFTLVGANA